MRQMVGLRIGVKKSQRNKAFLPISALKGCKGRAKTTDVNAASERSGTLALHPALDFPCSTK